MAFTLAMVRLVCHFSGLTFHAPEFIWPAVICTITGELALLPVLLLRKSDVGTVSQAGLVGLVVHMFLTLISAAILWMIHLIHFPRIFVFGLLGFFWISLILLVMLMVLIVRQAANPTSK